MIFSHIAEVFKDQHVVFVELLDGALQRQSLASLLQALHEIGRSGEQDPVAVLDERVAEGCAEMGLSRSARADDGERLAPTNVEGRAGDEDFPRTQRPRRSARSKTASDWR